MEEKVKIANQIASAIGNIVGVKSSTVDDYNKYGSFQIVAYLDLDKNKRPNNKDFSLRKIRLQIQNILKENVKNKRISMFGKSIETPKRMYDKYSYRGFSESYFKGYERDYIMIDFEIH
ncbi:MAG: hypothetical protein KatS3mg035_0994 [Bacteroidia bacterium]|nr:MAG: hypothetical protein KatS3mg035_0994 [Bacteroidia bacterium]